MTLFLKKKQSDIKLSIFLNRIIVSVCCVTRRVIELYWVDAKVSADFFSFLCFKFLLKQNTINQQRIYHCYL